jgi:hypothetical protein
VRDPEDGDLSIELGQVADDRTAQERRLGKDHGSIVTDRRNLATVGFFALLLLDDR